MHWLHYFEKTGCGKHDQTSFALKKSIHVWMNFSFSFLKVVSMAPKSIFKKSEFPFLYFSEYYVKSQTSHLTKAQGNGGEKAAIIMELKYDCK
jgi:hypothetical protein